MSLMIQRGGIERKMAMGVWGKTGKLHPIGSKKAHLMD